MQTKISITEYTDIFCKKTKVQDRYALYVSKTTYEKLRKVMSYLFSTGINKSSFTDNVMNHHIDSFADIISEIERENRNDFFKIKRE